MGGGAGAECPPETFNREIFGDKSGKMREGKNVEEDEEKRKREGVTEMEISTGKSLKSRREKNREK